MVPPLVEQVFLAALVDLDGTILVMLAMFLTFFGFVSSWVVKPLVRAQELRHARMEGARRDAESMDLRSAEEQARYAADLLRARGEAVLARDALTADGKARAQELLAGVQDEVEQKAAQALGALERDAAQGRRELDSHAEDLAERIATKLVGGSR
jgi:F0F1-type ATP synthase membrane subunit b/b'